MKKLITILLLSPLFSMAQPAMFMDNDSAKVKINVSIQARDAEYIGSFLTSGFYTISTTIPTELNKKLLTISALATYTTISTGNLVGTSSQVPTKDEIITACS